MSINDDSTVPAPKSFHGIDTYDMPPAEDELWTLGIFKFEGLNFRGQPSLTGDIITALAGERKGMINEGYTPEVDGYCWLPVYIKELNFFGWMAKYKLSSPDTEFFTFVDCS